MGDKKTPPYHLKFPATFPRVGTCPANFKNFSFNTFSTLLSNYKVISTTIPKLLNLNQDHSSKKSVFMVRLLYN